MQIDVNNAPQPSAAEPPKDDGIRLEYRVTPSTRYIVTRYTADEQGGRRACEYRGEYDNENLAHEVAYALCKLEHDQRGWAPGDTRIRYPERPFPTVKVEDAAATASR